MQRGVKERREERYLALKNVKDAEQLKLCPA